MQTDELIARLAADTTPARPIGRPLALAALATIVLAAVPVLGMWGPRPDLPAALASAAYWMKTLYTLALGAAGLAIAVRLARPGGRAPVAMSLAGAALLVVLALAVAELARTPSADWMPAVKGQTWRVCSERIALAAAPGFALAMWLLRRAAPTRPALAGAAAGVMAGGLAATVYGLHCDERAAVFVGVWYTLGVAVWAAVGALVGPRLLRW